MPLEGKGFFIWKIPDCETGDPRAIADRATEGGLTHVLIKVADTVNSYNIYDGVDRVPPVAQALRANDIQVWGWHYVTGGDPLGEANKAIERARTLHLEGYVIDAEKEYKEPGKKAAAKKFVERLRDGLPDTPIALSSYRYPSLHPQIPWKEFLEGCDLNMPQVYWVGAHNAGDQLARCVREFQTLAPYRPVIPTGAAYKEYGWQTSPAEAVDFLQISQSLNLTAANFYSWDSSRKYLPEVWSAIRDYSWTQKPGDITAQLVAALNTNDPEQILSLYAPAGVHITAARTIQGHPALRVWYQTLFDSILPNARFVLTGWSGHGSTRHFSWTATSTQGKVLNGNDTLGLSNDKIAYHYTFFSISS